MTRPNRIEIVEVGPRDGLQNETEHLSPAERIDLIEKLALAGLKQIEAGSFVSPRWVPQMAGSDVILESLRDRDDLRLPVLVPNMQGYENARLPECAKLRYSRRQRSLSPRKISIAALTIACSVSKRFVVKRWPITFASEGTSHAFSAAPTKERLILPMWFESLETFSS